MDQRPFALVFAVLLGAGAGYTWCQDLKAAEERKGYDLIFYGDSITEFWHGSGMCRPCKRCEPSRAVFDRHYEKHNAGALGISGDQVGHLIWRLQEGELPLLKQPKAVVLLIGTNDLGVARNKADEQSAEGAISQAAPGVALRVLHLLQYLRDNLPNTQIVLLALLPRGVTDWNQGAHSFAQPSFYTPGIGVVNAHFKAFAGLDDHTHFLDCSDRFLSTTKGGPIAEDLMPDALHPSPEGYELLAECLDPLISTLMQPA